MGRLLLVSTALFAAVFAQPCAGSAESLINAAGSTFAYPLYSKWFKVYSRESAEARFTYDPVGSGEGVRRITARQIDFGASDGPMTEEQLKAAGAKLLHVPVALGAVIATYNLPGSPALRLTPDLVADLFLGKVTTWNDARLRDLNPGVSLPNLGVKLVYRSDGSGTTYVLADYLSKVSPEWRDGVGRGTLVRWPPGTGAKGNEGVIRQVRVVPGALGYVELAYAVANRLPVARIRNRSGQFVGPSLESTSAAATAAISSIPDDFRASLTDAPGEGSYPIVSFTWALLYQEQVDQAKGRALVNFLWWATRDGQAHAKELNYAPLPPSVASRVETKLQEVTYRGRAILSSR